VNYGYSSSRKNYYFIKGEYLFPNRTVLSENNETDVNTKDRNMGVFFRAIYRTKQTVISNIVNLVTSKHPDNYSARSETFNTDDYLSSVSESFTDSRNKTISWNGNYQFYLPNDFSLMVNPSASFGTFDSDYKYIAGNAQVINNTDEDAWSAAIKMSLSKSYKGNMFTLLINGAAGENDMVYSGTTPSTVDAKSYTGGVMATAFLKFNNLTVNPTANFYVDRNVFDGVGYTRYNPRYYVTAGYMVNAKNRINFSSEMYYMTPPISQMGPNIQIQDQIDAITGNPKLKTEIVNLFQLNYTCMAHRFLSLNAYCSYSHNSRLATSIFEPLNVNEHYYMLRTLQNRGFRNSYKYGIAASSRLIGNTLSLRVGLEGNSANQHGGIDYNTTRLSYNAQATYSFSNAHVTVAYQSKDKSMMTWGTVEKPQYYYVTLGWRYKNINLKGIAIVPFNSAYRGAIRKNMAENRTLITQVHSESYHRSFEIGIIYSFSYGKKLGSIPQVTTPTAVQSGALQ
jgi:hypothetical protein